MTEKLREFYDAGARHFVFLPATGGAEEGPVLECLFAEVVPALHEHAAAAAGLTRSRPD